MVMAMIYSITGEYDLAIDEVEYHLSIPGWSSPEFFLADPIFAPLREIPRFEEVLRKHSEKAK